jgi:hypothetical protein
LILTTLIAAAGLAQVQAHAQTDDITGGWQGTLPAGGANLRLVLHVSKAADGSLKANLDSLDQGVNIPVNSVTYKDSRLCLSLEMIHGSYEDKISTDGNVISGTWTQGQPFPLDFKRAAPPNTPGSKRPCRP